MEPTVIEFQNFNFLFITNCKCNFSFLNLKYCRSNKLLCEAKYCVHTFFLCTHVQLCLLDMQQPLICKSNMTLYTRWYKKKPISLWWVTQWCNQAWFILYLWSNWSMMCDVICIDQSGVLGHFCFCTVFIISA